MCVFHELGFGEGAHQQHDQSGHWIRVAGAIADSASDSCLHHWMCECPAQTHTHTYEINYIYIYKLYISYISM